MPETIDIDALERLLAAATRERWARTTRTTKGTDADGSPWEQVDDEIVATFRRDSPEAPRAPEEWYVGYLHHRADADMIVALRNAAPRLLACWRAAMETFATNDYERAAGAYGRLRAIVTGEDGDG